ncbi:hypothetical protein BC332_01411 [Capsicum chinense]|nr:hypothetical protein BC332_01411 [Capsicum chinense]
MKFFLATTIRRKIILEDGLIAVDDGSGSGAVVRTNDTPLTVFKTKSHYDYDHTGCTDFFSDLTTFSECSACKCQDYKAKHDGVINAINALTASVKKITSKRAVIPSKRISYPYTLLEIKTAKRRTKDTFKASSSIEKSKIAMPLSLSCIVVQCARATREDCGLFVAAYAKYLSDGLQVPNYGRDAGLLRKRYAALLWKYGEAKAQKPYASDIKDPQRRKLNFAAPDEKQLVYIE